MYCQECYLVKLPNILDKNSIIQMSETWPISSSISNHIETTLSTLITQTISSPSDIYDPRITRPFALIC